MQSEFEIRDQIVEFLRKKGIMCWLDRQVVRKPSKGVSSRSKGVPDIMGILSDGTFLGIEVKTEKGLLSEEQASFLAKAQDLGAMCFVARNLQDVINRFK